MLNYKKPKTLIIISIVATVIVCMAFCFFFPFSLSNKITKGIFIDGIDLSGLNKEQAESVLEEYERKLIEEAVITLNVDSSSTDTKLTQYGFDLDFNLTIDKALSAAKKGNVFERIIAKKKIANDSLMLKSEVILDGFLVKELISDYALQYNIDLIDSKIEFDPSEYDYFDENADLSTMFEIVEGTAGQKLDEDAARALFYILLNKKQSLAIDLPFIDVPPLYTLQELEACTTLVCHSSCFISTSQRLNTNRNHNIKKVLDRFKGLVVMPQETVSFYDVIGEPSPESGYFPPWGPLISSTIFNEDFYPGVSQAATSIYNAAFMAGAEIFEVNHHSYPAYYTDYGYGMDAYVEYGEKDLVFKNTSDYPMFFDAYFFYDANNIPSYVDVDVYTMPQEDNTYIKALGVLEELIEPPETQYKQINNNTFNYLDWLLDEALGNMVAQYQKAKEGYKVRVYKVICEDCKEIKPGVWSDGKEVSRKETDYVIYPSIPSIIYSKPLT